MDWDKLRIFNAVAKAGSLTKAEKELKLSQSVLSRHVMALEDEFGLPLFLRHSRGLTLSEYGEYLFRHTQEAVARLSDAVEALKYHQSNTRGPLAVTVSEAFGLTWLTPRLKKFYEANPDILLNIIITDKVLNLTTREADVALRMFAPEEQGLIQRRLSNIPFYIYGSKKYLAKRGTPERAEDLAAHTLIGYPAQGELPYENANWLLSLAVENIRDDASGSKGTGGILRINSLDAMVSLVCNDVGLAALPSYIEDSHPEMVRVLPALEPHRVNLYLVYAQGHQNSEKIKLFRDFVLNELAEKA